jgi:hypothetical protein
MRLPGGWGKQGKTRKEASQSPALGLVGITAAASVSGAGGMIGSVSQGIGNPQGLPASGTGSGRKASRK